MYDATPDFTPIYDRSSLGGFYSLRGTSGNQFKNAPVVGRLGALLVQECENHHDHDSSPIQLPLKYTSGSLDLGHFSRLRAASSTTCSVLGLAIALSSQCGIHLAQLPIGAPELCACDVQHTVSPRATWQPAARLPPLSRYSQVL